MSSNPESVTKYFLIYPFTGWVSDCNQQLLTFRDLFDRFCVENSTFSY